MGKQSKRKKNFTENSKNSHKERLQERRHRIQDQLDEQQQQQEVHEGEEDRFAVLDVGDRVWYNIEREEAKRGVIKQFLETKEQNLYSIPGRRRRALVLPVEAPDDKRENLIELSFYVPDSHAWVLRFNKDDRVLVGYEGVWWAARVFDTFLVTEVGRVRTVGSNVPLAKIRVKGLACNLMDENGIERAQHRLDDEPECIHRLPTSFRFDVGDEVVFCFPNSRRWMSGKVLRVNVTGMVQYGAYECSYVDSKGRKKKQFVPVDRDEFIASQSATPRERLLDAIAQDCSPAHMQYIVDSLGMDAKYIVKMLTSEAIRTASYLGLWWLEESWGVKLDEIEDEHKNSLLHQIAARPNCTDFFRRAVMYARAIRNKKSWEGMPLIELHCCMLTKPDNHGHRKLKTNLQGDTWLHVLIKSGNKLALSTVLSPHDGLGTEISHNLLFLGHDFHEASRNGAGVTALACVRQSYQTMMVPCMVEELFNYDLLHQIAHILSTSIGRKDANKAFSLLERCVIDEMNAARRVLKILNEDFWGRSVSSVVADWCSNGEVRVIRWLLDVDPSLLALESWRKTIEDRNEFGQPELFQFKEEDDETSMKGLVACTVLGKTESLPKITHETSNDLFDYYNDILPTLAQKKDREPLISFLQGILKRYENYGNGSLIKWLEYKIKLLKDDEDLDRRLEVLNYLVNEKGMEPPDVVDVVRWRQCGVLRWLVAGLFINLQEKAHANRQINDQSKTLVVVDKASIPTSMTVGAVLGLVAIEFDDLQTFEWLVKQQDICVQSMRCAGWNVLHACAYFGRAEILFWLCDNGVPLDSLLSEKCGRKPWQSYFAAHLALARGQVFVADVLLSLAGPSVNGKTIDKIASRSTMQHVRKWAKERERPISLDRDVRKLVMLLDQGDDAIEAVMQHVKKTQCLNFERWKDDCIYGLQDPGPACGLTYMDLFKRTCKQFRDLAFLSWLCVALSPKDKYKLDNMNLFWSRDELKTEDIPLNNIIDRINFGHDEFLVKCISKRWARDLTCKDPLEENPVLLKMTEIFQGDEELSVHLHSLRCKILRSDVLKLVHEQTRLREIPRMFYEGAHSEQIDGVFSFLRSIAVARAEQNGGKLHDYFDDYEIFSPRGKVRMGSHPLLFKATENEHRPLHSISLMLTWEMRQQHSLFVVLVEQGYEEIIRWTLFPDRNAWDEQQEIDAVRIAAFLGHARIADTFLSPKDNLPIKSTLVSRYCAALLGAAEAGREHDVQSYFADLINLHTRIPDDMRLNLWSDSDWQELSIDNSGSLICSSLVATTIYGYLNGKPASDPTLEEEHRTRHFLVLKYVESRMNEGRSSLLFASALAMTRLRSSQCLARGVLLVQFIFQEFPIDSDHDVMGRLCQEYVRCADLEDNETTLETLKNFLRLATKLGTDIQSVSCDAVGKEPLKEAIKTFQRDQRSQWSRFDIVKQGCPFAEIERAINDWKDCTSSRDQGGLFLTHVAAAHDRLDVMKWLVEEKNMPLDAVNLSGQTALDVADAACALSVSNWIWRQDSGVIISVFATSHFRRRLVLRRFALTKKSVISVQAWVRGMFVRKRYRGSVLKCLEDSQRFQAIWGKTLALVKCFDTRNASCWETIKHEQHDVMISPDVMGGSEYDNKELLRTSKVLGNAAKGAMVVDAEPDIQCDKSSDTTVDFEPSGVISDKDVKVSTANFEVNKITMTKEVAKWLRTADSKYVDFFIRRVGQLAAGEMSRILAKALTGCKTSIYETYLEQKSGHRILWTREESCGLLIWYVARHKEVPRLLRLIDNSEDRSRRQLILTSGLTEVNLLDGNNDDTTDEQVLLDPFGNTPLKLYEVEVADLGELANKDWRPQLHLTKAERSIVESPGTVCVLGRSGTGKTVCICNRMEYDRQCYRSDASFSQLFVSRSQRLCRYVKETVGSGTSNAHGKTHFMAFHQLLSFLETELPFGDGANAQASFLPSQRVDFRRFKGEVYAPNSGSLHLDALVVWTNIRSFIKGSIEALQSKDLTLSEEEYLALGKRRCRMSPEQRKAAYSSFLDYQLHLRTRGLWDMCDRVNALVGRMRACRRSDPNLFQHFRFSKIYVDEVQDYTQAEIALLFYLAGPGNLFLAGDPAQSVVEGADFRFEDIRSVVHILGGHEKRYLIPDKPMIVNVNFRSHSGILNLAAMILRQLFRVFPDSAKQLKEDRGLFRGPRPSVLLKVECNVLRLLVSRLEGVVVLSHDERVTHWKRTLQYPLVYSIRESKGLEFHSVLILDFFAGIPTRLQKGWRDLMLGQDVVDVANKYPEIEGQLKLLYTAVTRGIQQLFFAETESSVSGDAFVRALTSTSIRGQSNDAKALAVKTVVDSIEAMVRTPDEWRSAGLDNAIMAESSVDDVSVAQTWLEKAIYCFEKGGDKGLARKARAHMSALHFVSRIDPDAGSLELELAALLEKMLVEGLLLEAQDTCRFVLPYFGNFTQLQLQTHFLAKLPTRE